MVNHSKAPDTVASQGLLRVAFADWLAGQDCPGIDFIASPSRLLFSWWMPAWRDPPKPTLCSLNFAGPQLLYAWVPSLPGLAGDLTSPMPLRGG